MVRAYRFLLNLYPYDFRLWFAAEMLDAFTQSAADRHAVFELATLLAGAAAEWLDKWMGDRDARARALPDWRMMRPAGISKEAWFEPGGGGPGGFGPSWSGPTRRPCSSDT